ncbi:MAG: hypothetical protein ACRC3Y_03835, partial [Romboutsia sp.]|uniref:hypothetical protein n=1 Tax=Romboutsia sp. TaxID=1965302 RepID=UPI003F3F7AD0
MNNNKIKKIVVYALISIFVIINSKNIVFADINYNENNTNLNKVKIDKNLQLYVSGSGILIYGELINPLSIGCINEELTDIPKDSTLKSIKYKNPINNKIVEIKDVSRLHQISQLFKYPDNMKIDLIILDSKKIKKISTDILNLRNHQWTMNVGAGGT